MDEGAGATIDVSRFSFTPVCAQEDSGEARGATLTADVRKAGQRPDALSDALAEKASARKDGRWRMASDWYDPASMDWLGADVHRTNEAGGDQIVVLRGISWAYYDALVRARGDAPRPRMAYLDGLLEIMTTGPKHELEKKLLARLVEAFADESGLELDGLGNTTFRRKAKQAGLEPDECYCVGGVKKVPELAIEIAHTSGSIDKLEIYRRIGVREVWFVVEQRIHAFRLLRDRYRRSNTSGVLRGFDLAEIERILGSSGGSSQSQIVRAYRKSLRAKRGG